MLAEMTPSVSNELEYLKLKFTDHEAGEMMSTSWKLQKRYAVESRTNKLLECYYWDCFIFLWRLWFHRRFDYSTNRQDLARNIPSLSYFLSLIESLDFEGWRCLRYVIQVVGSIKEVFRLGCCVATCRNL